MGPVCQKYAVPLSNLNSRLFPLLHGNIIPLLHAAFNLITVMSLEDKSTVNSSEKRVAGQKELLATIFRGWTNLVVFKGLFKADVI